MAEKKECVVAARVSPSVKAAIISSAKENNRTICQEVGYQLKKVFEQRPATPAQR